MTLELDVLRDVSERLVICRVPFMVTGSMALAYYAAPRMTRDIDIVVALAEAQLDALQRALWVDFYIDFESARQAIRAERLFNVMHYSSAIKIDLIVRKSTQYRQLEFERRRPVTLGGVATWIVSREDLILSKLAWAQDSKSELQRRDVQQLLAGPVDREYLRHWAGPLGVESALLELMP